MDKSIRDFQEIVWEYYHAYGRDLPWRQCEANGSLDPYRVLVSEIMLQQTQAVRVVPKFQEFITLFPDVRNLSAAPWPQVLTAWSGLGYNRRAKFLWQTARIIEQEYAGELPANAAALTAMPGVGLNTANAILAYAFNAPVVFIETNIRSVFIHHFFKDQELVDDKQLLPVVELALDREHPREWYWALMDYGVHLKTTVGNASRSSRHYIKQSAFEGSRRQARGKVLKLLTERPYSSAELSQIIADPRIESIIVDLLAEGLVAQNGDQISL